LPLGPRALEALPVKCSALSIRIALPPMPSPTRTAPVRYSSNCDILQNLLQPMLGLFQPSYNDRKVGEIVPASEAILRHRTGVLGGHAREMVASAGSSPQGA
jgi:hypothetical protein